MPEPRKIVVASTDGRYLGQEVSITNGEATIGGFTFNVTAIIGNRIIGPNYSVTYAEN